VYFPISNTRHRNPNHATKKTATEYPTAGTGIVVCWNRGKRIGSVFSSVEKAQAYLRGRQTIKTPPAKASGGGSISMGILRTRPLSSALKICHQVNQSQQATKNPHQPKPMRVSSQPTHSSRPRALSRPNAKFVKAIIWLKSWRIVKKLTHLT